MWGAGVIDDAKELPAHPKKVLAVRGPLSRKYLLDRGIECPAVYGDPALLVPKVYHPSVTKSTSWVLFLIILTTALHCWIN